VRVGDRDTCGQVLGQIASSGCSTGAHLHFEVRPRGGGYMTAFDPFMGPCSPTTPSRFTSQGPWRGIPGDACDGTPTCPAGTYPIWTCDTARASRRRCIAGVDETEPCPYGCVVMPVGVDDVCSPPPDADGDGSPDDLDCDDANASIHPGAAEVCGDSIDQDCAGGDLPCGIDVGPPPIDSGPADASDAEDRDAAMADAGAPFDASRDGTLTGGCSCRAAGAGGAAGPVVSVLVAVLAAIRRRR
jgi:MYXO-CTERM domain-containing protein